MLLPIILLVSTIPTISGQQCSTSSDCSSPDAPYCSKWGWCQWTSQFGSAGPREVARTGSGLPLGSCRSSGDCTPRAPVCSSQGFCTWEPAYQVQLFRWGVNTQYVTTPKHRAITPGLLFTWFMGCGNSCGSRSLPGGKMKACVASPWFLNYHFRRRTILVAIK